MQPKSLPNTVRTVYVWYENRPCNFLTKTQRPVSYPSLASLTDFTGKVIAITGAGSGIGRRAAVRFAEAGAKVYLLDIDEAALTEQQEELTELDYTVAHRVLNVTDLEQIKEVASSIVEAEGRLDGWMNIAGIYPGGETLEMDGDTFDRTININLKGNFFCAQQAAKAMIETGSRGAIVNIISTTVYRPVPGLPHYIASKAGVEGWTRALAKELGPHGIRVTAVAPTMVRTGGLEDQKEGLAEAFGTEDPFAAFAQQLPLGDDIADPDQVARVIFFAASDLGVTVTGSTLFADLGENLL